MSETTGKDAQLEQNLSESDVNSPGEPGAEQQRLNAILEVQRLATERAFQDAQAQQAGEATTTTHPDCARLDGLISKLDETFAAFERLMSEFIDESDLPENLKTRLKQPFATYNQYLNLGQTRNRARMGRPKSALDIFGGDKLFFDFKDSKDSNDNAYASFKPYCRTIELRKGFDPKSTMDLFVLYHELVHVHQDDIARPNHFGNISIEDLEAFDISTCYQILKRLDQVEGIVNLEKRIEVEKKVESYLKSEGSPARLIDREAEAYGLQLELLDIILEEKLRIPSHASFDLKSKAKEQIMHKIATAAQHNKAGEIILNNLGNLARLFFPNGLQGDYQPAYLKEIEKYTRIGAAQ